MNVSGHPGASSPEGLLNALRGKPKLRQLETLLGEFNSFDVLDVARSELSHSRVIAWLLDPRGSHGLGETFLRSFLREAAVSASSTGIDTIGAADIDSWELSQTVVFKERHHIDILVMDDTNRYVCLIQNKISSGEHSDQLSRDMKVVERSYGHLTPLPVFLTPGGIQPEKRSDAERYAPLSYGKVAEIISHLLKDQVGRINAGVLDLLKQYELTIRRRVMNAPNDIDKLAHEIYSDHREAIDHIIRTRSRLGSIDWDLIESVVAETAPDLQDLLVLRRS